jgi:hypothetical protein
VLTQQPKLLQTGRLNLIPKQIAAIIITARVTPAATTAAEITAAIDSAPQTEQIMPDGLRRKTHRLPGKALKKYFFGDEKCSILFRFLKG